MLPISEVESLVVDILQRHNTRECNAISVAKALVSAEIDGQSGHGLSRLAHYAAQSASGKVNGRATPQLLAKKHGGIRIDAKHGFAFPACDLAVDELHKSALDYGIAAVSIFRSHHFGQAGYHAERLARQGLIALVFSNSPQAIAPWGGSKGLFGTNPIAFAAPRAQSIPLLVDLSLSKVARGKVMVARQRGDAIPEGWALNKHGQPTTDPQQALEGTMLPMGDAKGAALVLMVEVLAAALGGANFGYEASSFFIAEGPPPAIGHSIIAMDPDFFSGGLFSSRLESLIAAMLEQGNVRLPGSNREALRVKAAEQGVLIPHSLWDEWLKLRS